MGLFNKRPSKNRVYTLKQAMEFVKNNEDYSAVETNGGYKLVHDDKAKKEISMFRQKRLDFINEISGNGAYHQGYRNHVLAGQMQEPRAKDSNTADIYSQAQMYAKRSFSDIEK